MLSPTRPSAWKLERLLDRAAAAAPSYPEIGATRDATLPDGYRIDHYELRFGAGAEVFPRAVQALRGWKAHLAAGVEVLPVGAHVGAGDNVLLVTRAAGLWAVAPSRVIYVEDEPDRFAFGYGTLPGHPERGEAAMTLERAGAGVLFRIVSFSRPAGPLARLGAPLARRIQRRVTQRYLEELATAASRPE